MKKIIMGVLAGGLVTMAVCLVGCGGRNHSGSEGEEREGYHQISQEEAKKMMTENDSHVIVDVRRWDEFEQGHIPGAICIPNESIDTAQPKELPDLDQIILVYCRSGRRSKEASQKLYKIGYTNVYEFGGIMDWTGEITTENNFGTTQSTESIEDTKNFEAAAENDDIKTIRPVPMLVVKAGERIFYATLEDNSSAKALTEKLSTQALTLDMREYGGFEKVGELPWELPANDQKITTKPGDVILYQGNQLTIYYENTWSFTKIATMNSVTKDELLKALGEGDG